MRLEAKKYLYDIQQAASLIVQFTEAKPSPTISRTQCCGSQLKERLPPLAKLSPNSQNSIPHWQHNSANINESSLSAMF